MASSSSSSRTDDNFTLTNAPNKGYEMSGKIMLSAVVVLFAVVIIMACLHLYARRSLIRARRRYLHRRNRNRRHNIGFHADSAATAAPRGLDPAVVKSIPALVFNEASEQKEVAECAVCLSEFEDGEKGRSLPKCKHDFHIDCIDLWFRSHSTCPLCRAPVESVAEVANSGDESQVVVVDSASQGEPGASSVQAPVGVQQAARTVSIENPMRNEPTENGSSTDSPPTSKAPVRRMMSLRRILNRGLSMSPPYTARVCSAVEGCDLEIGTLEDTESRTESDSEAKLSRLIPVTFGSSRFSVRNDVYPRGEA